MATVSEFILDSFQRTTFSDGKSTNITRTYGTLSNNMSDNLDPKFALEPSLQNEDFFGQLFRNKPSSAKIEKFWHFPVWPPDAFAIASALLERSGAYTRLTPHYIHASVAKEDLDRQHKMLEDGQNFFRWGHIGRRSRNFTRDVDAPPNARFDKRGQHKESEQFIADHVNSLRHGIDKLRPLDSQFDPFGVLGGNQLELRLAGTLWAHGAVYLSQPLIAADLNPPTVDHPTNQAAVHVLIALHRIMTRAFKQLDDRYPRMGQTTWRDISELIVRGYKQDNRHKDPYTNYRMLATRGKDKQPRKPFTVSECHVSYMYNALTKLHLQLTSKNGDATSYDEDIEELISDSQDDPETVLKITGDEIIHSYLICKWAIDYIQARWSFLLLAEDPVSSELNSVINADLVDWCAPCFRFLILADEASISLGFGNDVDSLDQEIDYATDVKRMRANRETTRPDRKLKQEYKDGDSLNRLEHLEYSRLFPRTLCDRFNSDYGSVLPKSRTPQVGCTLRSLSHHLAFLPPKGRVRGRWLVEDRKYVKNQTKSTVELLLIPYPYAFRSTYLKRKNGCTEGFEHLNNWGWFEVEQGWNSRIKNFGVKRPLTGDELERRKEWGGPTDKETVKFRGLAALVDMLRSSADFDIDGVVFPELSLDYKQYKEVSDYLLRYATHPERVFLVGGIALNDQPPQSAAFADGKPKTPMQNSVVMAFNHREASKPEWGNRRWDIEWAREKHHRWKLDEWQLKRYALSHRLDPSMVWWEDLAVKSREVGFMEFHPGSIATALICEDLARIEPAQIAIRSVGPNLVFVLLMDGPQIPNRWSNQYAGVLADDPGSSVLTMSSMGLIHRTNTTSPDQRSRSFALWRDQLGGLQEIELPVGYHAVNISLKRTNVQEQTMDMRADPGDTTAVWTLVGVNPIRIDADGKSIRQYKFFEHVDGKNEECALSDFTNAFSFEG